MNENTPPPQLMGMGTPVQGIPIQMPARETASVGAAKIQVPISWVITLLVAAVGGAFSAAAAYLHAEARMDALQTQIANHSGAAALHYPPQDAAEGGLVSKRAMRRILRTMVVTCNKAGACLQTLPSEIE